MSKATGNDNSESQGIQEEGARKDTWFDIANSLLSVGNFTAGESFRITLADVLRSRLWWNVTAADVLRLGFR